MQLTEDGLHSAIDCFQRAIEMRARSLAWIGVAWEYEPYREDDRFRELVGRIGIPMKNPPARRQ